MIVAFKRSFLQDVRKLPKEQRERVERLITNIENVDTMQEITNMRKMRGEQVYYRIRQGNYRCGITFEDGVVTFVRYLHRRDIYRYFP